MTFAHKWAKFVLSSIFYASRYNKVSDVRGGERFATEKEGEAGKGRFKLTQLRVGRCPSDP